jgi:hypothetical protein
LLRNKACVPVPGGWAVASAVVYGRPPLGDILRRLTVLAPGLRVPEGDREEGLEALGARPWNTAALTALLDEIDTSSCTDQQPFRDLVEAMRAAAPPPPKGWAGFLERWSVGGPRPASIVVSARCWPGCLSNQVFSSRRTERLAGQIGNDSAHARRILASR